MVLVNRLVDGLRTPAVVSDDSVGIRSAVSHLVSLGHRLIGHVAGPPEISVSASRLAALLGAMDLADADPRPTPVVVHADGYTVEAGRAALVELLRRHAVTAVLAVNDLVAVGCYQALTQAGLRCPQDVSVVGFNDMPLTAHLHPPLSTVAMPQSQMGRAAAELILKCLAEPDSEHAVVALPTRFIERRSAAAVR